MSERTQRLVDHIVAEVKDFTPTEIDDTITELERRMIALAEQREEIAPSLKEGQ